MYQKNIYIGKLIEQQIILKGISFAEFARQLNCDRSTVYNIIKSKSIDIDRLLKISTILDYDFIANVYLVPNNNALKNIELMIPPDKLEILKNKSIEEVTLVITFKE